MVYDTPIDALKTAIGEFSLNNPNCTERYRKGMRLIVEGEEGSDFFLIEEGCLSISVKDPLSLKEKEVALRYRGDLIGETAVLQRRGRRNANVDVVSAEAKLVRISRKDALILIGQDPKVRDAIVAIWELSMTRRRESIQVVQNDVRIENKLMSVLIADIHNFSILGETAWEEFSDLFLFEFIEGSEAEAVKHGGDFEDQGDGFKIVFEGEVHVDRAVECGVALYNNFHILRSIWTKQSNGFCDIGLGIAICTDCMSIRRRAAAGYGRKRIASHTINIAAAMAKFRKEASDVGVYLDDASASMLQVRKFDFDGPREVWLERIRRNQSVHKFMPTRAKAGSAPLPPNREMVDISVLFVAADPTNEARLHLGREVREVQERIWRSRYRDRFSFHQRHALRPSDLSQALLEIEPQIVHFSGHGAGEKGLCFEGLDGRSKQVGSEALSALFREFSSKVRCVILNACYTEAQLPGIAKSVQYVIGMNNAISDNAAIAFVSGFYQALGAGKTIQEAHRLGCVEIGLCTEDVNEMDMPVITCQ